MQKMMYICAAILTNSLYAMQKDPMVMEYNGYFISCARGENNLTEGVEVSVNFIEKDINKKKKDFFDYVANKNANEKKYDFKETASGFEVVSLIATLVVKFSLPKTGTSFQSREIDVKDGDGLVFNLTADGYRINIMRDSDDKIADEDTVKNASARYEEQKK